MWGKRDWRGVWAPSVSVGGAPWGWGWGQRPAWEPAFPQLCVEMATVRRPYLYKHCSEETQADAQCVTVTGSASSACGSWG